ncbi:hypothetical protein ACFOEK_09565 [Litoribrevibacter euphylliae]|uniref:Outer membrane protein OmpA-like transmembrane domain-containing protein n=1 Tax=Litoribrevibacter euphylliae TaxID=1834034 RepID=A0ABV7HI90_9GAMM
MNKVRCSAFQLILFPLYFLLSLTVNAASVVSVSTVPADGTYEAGDTLTFDVTFDENVTVTRATSNAGLDNIWLELSLDSGSFEALYTGGTGTTVLTFTGTLTSADFDFDGIELSHIELSDFGTNSSPSTIKNASAQDADLTLNGVPDLSMVLVDHGNDVSIESPPVNSSYDEGDEVEIYLRWRRTDGLALQGTPELNITVGATPYTLSGEVFDDALKFIYTVQSGDLDNDGISLDSFTFNGGSLSASNFTSDHDLSYTDHSLMISDNTFTTYPAIKVGPIGAPIIDSVSGPSAGTYTVNDVLTFTVNYNENVTISNANANSKLYFETSNGEELVATYQSGTGTTALVFQYTVQQGDFSSGLDVTRLVPSSFIIDADVKFSDLVLNNIADLSGVILDGSVPAITSITVPTATTYVTGDTLTFKVNFDELVNVNGKPQLLLNIGGETVAASYVSGTGSTQLVFTYQVVTGVDDTDGITIEGLSLNNGTIKDADGNSLDAELMSVGDTSEIYIDGGTKVTSVSVPSAATYGFGETLVFTVSFDETVTVSGVPSLVFDIGGASTLASYTSGSGSSDLVFQYTVEVADNDTDGIEVLSLRAQSATIRNANSLDADLDLVGVADTSSVLVDGGAPSGYSFTVDQALIDTSNEAAVSLTMSGAEVGATYDLTVSSEDSKSGEVTATGTVTSANQQLTGINVSGLNDGDLLFALSLTDINSNQGKVVSDVVTKSTLSPAVASVDVPSNATYGSASTLWFTVNLNQAAVISGEPTLSIDIGGTSYDAEYQSDDSTTTSLVFSYLLTGAESDNDGIEINSLALNGGSIENTLGVAFDLTLNNVGVTTQVLVSTDSADNVLLSVLSSNGPLDVGDQLIVDITSQNGNWINTVNTAIPTVDVILDSGTVTASYTGKNGSALRYEYTIQAGNYHSASNLIELTNYQDNGADVTYNFVTFSYVFSLDGLDPLSGIDIVAISPEIESITTTGGNYSSGDTISISVAFTKDVTVVGSPFLDIDVGGTAKTATYDVGSSSADTLVFDYTVAGGDEDLDGIEVTSFDVNGGTVRDSNANDADLTLNNNDTRGAVIDATSPSGYGFGIDQAYINTENELNARFSFSGAEVGTTYNLSVTHNGGGAGSTAVSGTVSDSEQVISGIDVSGIDDGELLFSLTLTDSAGNAGSTVTDTVTKDTVTPVVSSVSAPTNGTYILNNTLQAQVQFDDVVYVTDTPQLALTIGAQTVYADYLSGSNTNTLIFQTTITSGLLDTDGISIDSINENGGLIEDVSGNDATLTLNNVADTSAVLVDGVVPEITSVNVPANDTYILGETLSFTVNFDDSVDVTGTPLLNLTLGANSETASYISGSGSSALVFTYTVASGDQDSDGISVDSLVLNSGTLKDANSNDASLTLNSVASTAAVLVDGQVPSVTSVSVPSNATYALGDTLSFTVNFDENVDVTGTPELGITLGTSAETANYVSGTGTSALVFEYTLVSGDLDENGIAVGSLTVNSDTIQDAAGNDATLTLNNVADTSAVLVDAEIPVVLSVSVPTSDTYKVGDVLSFIVNFNDSVSVSGVPELSLTLGSDAKIAEYVSGTGSSNLVFQYTVVSDDLDENGIAVNGLSAGGGSILDSAGNAATLTLNNIGSTASINIDGVAPVISSVAAPGSATYALGESFELTVSFDDVVIVSGTPSLSLTIGANSVSADYQSGSGTTDIVFSYTVASTDLDTDGIELNALSLGTASMLDVNGNSASTTLNGVESLAGVLVDGVVPSNYQVAFDETEWTKDNEASASISITGAEVGADYEVIISSSVGDAQVSSSGTISTASMQVSNIDLSGLSDGTLTASLVLTDSVGNEGAAATATSSKVNDAPEFIGTPIVSGTPQFGATLSVSNVNTDDHEGSEVTVSYQWLANDVDISGATSAAYTLTAAEAMTDISVEITANDGSASTTITVDAGTVSSLPVFVAPEDIEVNATGLQTLVEVVPPSAVDQFGNAIDAVAEGLSDYFEPGLHVIEWTADDGQGNSTSFTQEVRVHPLVNFERDKFAAEGNQAGFNVYLNGSAVSYPYTLDFVVGGTADSSDHTLVDGRVTFEEDETQASVTFDVVDDGLEESDETIVIEWAASTVNTGVFDQQTVTIVNRNVAPQVTLAIEQNGSSALLIGKNNGNVVLTATVVDVNADDTHSYQWFAQGLIDLDAESSTFTFSPQSISNGVHRIRVDVTDSGAPQAMASAALLLKVVDTLPVLTSADTDADGTADDVEGFGDDEFDGIPNYLDSIPESNVIPLMLSNQSSFLAECETGITCMLGVTSAGGLTGGILLDDVSGNGLGSDSEFEIEGGIYDFELSGLTPGESISIAIPLQTAIPVNAIYRKFGSDGQWHSFVETANNQLSSAAGGNGVCPPPGSDAWNAGLTEGHFCLQLTIEDGGPNDFDGEVNGVIVDPGAISTSRQVDNFETKGGGGAFNIWMLLLTGLVGVLTKARSVAIKYAVAILAFAGLVQVSVVKADQAPPLFGVEDFYVVGSFGWAWNEDGNREDLNAVFEDRGFNAEASEVENDRNVWSLGLGLNLTEHIAFEAVYLNLGEVDVEFSGSAAGQESAFSEAVADVYPESGDGIATSLRYNWQFVERGFVYGRAGVFFWESDYESSVLDGAQIASRSRSGTDLLLGAGIGHNFSDNFKGSLEVQRYQLDDDKVYQLSAQLNYDIW